MIVGSTGGRGGARPIHHLPDEPSGQFRVTYENTIDFKGSLLATVDNAFARWRMGDQDLKNETMGVLRPFNFLLREQYGLVPPVSVPVPNAAERAFDYSTDWSDWSLSNETTEKVRSVFKVLISSPAEGEKHRWRARVSSAQARFSSYRPKSVNVQGTIEFEMQVAAMLGGWKAVEFNAEGLEQFASLFRKRLNHSYYKYLREEWHLTLTPDFHGLREE